MDIDLRTFVTGGGILGEGIQIWDIRNLSQSTNRIQWGEKSNGDPNYPLTHAVKFMPGKNKIIAGCMEEPEPTKVFDTITGSCVFDFPGMKSSCFTVDISPNC